MTAPSLLIALAIATTVCAVASPPASASEDRELQALVNKVERETGGRVLSVERRNQSGRDVSRIKVYTPEGRVRVMWNESDQSRAPASIRPAGVADPSPMIERQSALNRAATANRPVNVHPEPSSDRRPARQLRRGDPRPLSSRGDNR